MKKLKIYLPVLVTMLLLSCRTAKQYNCSKAIAEGSVGFMRHGGILDKYDNGKVFISIVNIVNPKDWSGNEYITGNGFSKNKDDEMKVIEKDSCELKQKYFAYLKTL